MEKRSTWREMWHRALTSPYLLLLFVASILLSIASFYTTYEGIKPFVAFAVIAFFITAAIQSLLFVVSWRLGFMFAGKEDVAKVDMGVFVVCFSLSVFFSFNSLFNMIFVEERQQEASLGRVRDGATEVVDNVGQRLGGIHAELVESLRKSDAYLVWRRDVLQIADDAQSVDSKLREMVARKREQKQQQYEDKAEAARRLAARKGTMGDEIEKMKRQLEALGDAPADSTAEELRRQAQELEVQIATKQAELAAEEEGIAESGKSGRGPQWRAKDKERRVLQNRLNDIEEKIRIRTEQSNDYDQRRRQLAERLRETELLFANIDTEIERKRAEARAAREELQSFGSGGVDDTVQALREYPARFEEHSDITQLEQAESLCTQLLDEMKTLEMDLRGKSCDRGPISGMVAPIIETDKALADLDRQCLGADAPSFHNMAFDDALAAARHCLDLSKLPYKRVRDLREDLDRLEREEGPNASEFTKTTNALFAGEKDGYLALVLAVAMDLLVLFTGLIGAKSASDTFATPVFHVDRGDDPEVAAIKTLLKNLRAFDEKIGGTRYEAKIDLADLPDPRDGELIGPLLVRNTITGLVLQSLEKPDLYFLRYGAQQQLENRLEKLRQQSGEGSSGAQTAWHPRAPSKNQPAAGNRAGSRTPRRSPFFAKGERAPDHPDSRPPVTPGSAAAGFGAGAQVARDEAVASDAAPSTAAGSAPERYADAPGSGQGAEEPRAQAVGAKRPVSFQENESPEAGTPPAEDSGLSQEPPAPSCGSGEGKSEEDLGLVYGFLHQNEPGKPSSGGS